MEGYTCNVCGQYHEGLPFSYGSPAPDIVLSMDEKEQKRRVLLSSDQCEVKGQKLFDEKHYFILGNIDIPIIDSKEIFRWSIWVSLSKANYEKHASFGILKAGKRNLLILVGYVLRCLYMTDQLLI